MPGAPAFGGLVPTIEVRRDVRLRTWRIERNLLLAHHFGQGPGKNR